MEKKQTTTHQKYPTPRGTAATRAKNKYKHRKYDTFEVFFLKR